MCIRDRFFPSWKNAVSKSSFTVGGKEYTVQSDEDYLNPYVAGVLSEAIPVKAVNKDNKSIEVQYITKNGSFITGYWTLPAKGNHVEVRLSCRPATDGMYSICLLYTSHSICLLRLPTVGLPRTRQTSSIG